MLRTLAAILLVASCAASPQSPDYPAAQAAERLPLEICTIEGIAEPLLCGRREMPLDRTDPSRDAVSVSLIVIPAKNGNPDNRAWTEHQGGPGRTMLQYARLFAEGGYLEGLREDRDIVLLDQRGTGASGGLYCDALNNQQPFERYYTQAKVRLCLEQLGAQVNNRHLYSTLAAVDDLEDIRRWLGYPQFDVGGWSYGSRFMLTYAQRYPDSLRSMMLAVPTTFDYRRPLDWARFTESAIEGMFADCESEAACREAFPALRQDWTTLARRVAETPPELSYQDPASGETRTFLLNQDVLIDQVHGALIRVRNKRYLPFVIHEAAAGNYQPFIAFALANGPPARPIAEPQYLSVVCPEETAFVERTEASAAARDTFTGMHFVDEFAMACAEWGLPAHPDYPLEWTPRDIPTLIFSGDRDPITPNEYGARIAASLTRSRHIEVPGMPHDFSGLQGAECLERILFAFLDNPSPADVDAACVSTLQRPPFVTEAPEQE